MQTSKTSRFVAIICFDQHVCSDSEVVSGRFRPCMSRRRSLIARSPDPHVMCEGCPSRQPVANQSPRSLYPSSSTLLSFYGCLDTILFSHYTCSPCRVRSVTTLTDLLAESRGACVCACVICCVTPPRNKTSLPVACLQSIDSAIFPFSIYLPGSLETLPTKPPISINDQHLDISQSCGPSSLEPSQRFYLPFLH